MARTVKDLLAIKKMSYSRLTANQDGRGFGSGYSDGSGNRGRGSRDDLEFLLDRMYTQNSQANDLSKLMREIQYLEANLNSSFESISFLMTPNEERNLDCLADKDEA